MRQYVLNMEKNDNNTTSKRPGSWHSPERLAAIIETVTMQAELLCVNLGLELVHVEFQREAFGRIMRIYIDKTGGVGLKDCTELSRCLGDILDVVFPDDEIGPYSLEVTSPGSERPLAKLADYVRFMGRVVKLRLKEPINDQKNYRGKIASVTEDVILIDINQNTVEIPFTAIAKARLVEEDGEL